MTTTVPRVTVPVPLRIEVSVPSPGTVRLAVAGELDLATAPILGMRLRTVLTDHKPEVIDVDFAEVTFLDCSGIGVMVAARNAAERAMCQVWISHPQPMTATILDVVGLLGFCSPPRCGRPSLPHEAPPPLMPAD